MGKLVSVSHTSQYDTSDQINVNLDISSSATKSRVLRKKSSTNLVKCVIQGSPLSLSRTVPKYCIIFKSFRTQAMARAGLTF